MTVTLVVDASASIDAGEARDALGAVVDAVVDTGSTVGLIELSSSAQERDRGHGARRVDAGRLRQLPVGVLDRWHHRSAAGLTDATAASPDLVVVVTDGVANASSAGPGEAVAAAMEQANRAEGGGHASRGRRVGAADDAVLAAISGPRVGSTSPPQTTA